MKIIFLDIDGVLNNDNTLTRVPSNHQHVGISGPLVLRLRKIVKATDAKIVLTSDWQFDLIPEITVDGKYLLKKLGYKDLEIMDIAKIVNSGNWYRGTAIRKWLETNKDKYIENYVILDDNVFNFQEENLLGNFIWVNRHRGLANEDVEKAVKILN